MMRFLKPNVLATLIVELVGVDNPAELIVATVLPPDCRFSTPLLSAVVITPPAPLVLAFIDDAIFMLLLGEVVGCLQTAILGMLASLCFLGRWEYKHHLNA
jgi:hypothetical protein